MVEVGTATHNEKEVKKNWPVTEGLEAGTEKQTGRIMTLIPLEGSNVAKRFKVGIDD